MLFDLQSLLLEAGALQQGHFLLSSGNHSDRYVEKFHLLRRPVILERICAEIAGRIGDRSLDVIAGPTTGGILIAAEIARQLGIRAAYAERVSESSAGREFRRVDYFEEGDRVLVVDDILTTGGSVRETIDALKPHPVTLAGVMVLVDRSGGNADLGVQWEALERMDIPVWTASECPLCADGLPLKKPGTTPQPGGTS